MFLRRSIAGCFAFSVIVVPSFLLAAQPAAETDTASKSQLARAWEKRYTVRQKALSKRASDLAALRRDASGNSIENAWQKIYRKKAQEQAREQRRGEVIELLQIARSKMDDLKQESRQEQVELLEQIDQTDDIEFAGPVKEENFERPARLGAVAKFLQQQAAAKEILRSEEYSGEMHPAAPSTL